MGTRTTGTLVIVHVCLYFRLSFNDSSSKGGAEGKWNILPEVTLIEEVGFKRSELRMIEAIIEENREVIIERWKEYFKH